MTGEREAAKSEINPDIDLGLASYFLEVYQITKKTLSSRKGSIDPVLEQQIQSLLNLTVSEVPGINRDSLEKVLKYKRVLTNSTSESVYINTLDNGFLILAGNWENKGFADQRKYAERNFGIGQQEVVFLRAVWGQIPPMEFSFHSRQELGSTSTSQ